MEHEVWYKYPQAVKHLPDDVTFITTQELEDRYPFHTGTADTDRRNDCFCRYLCVPVFKEREKGKSSKLKTNPLLFSRNGVYLSIPFGTQKKNSTHNHPFQGHPAGRSQYN